MADLTEVWGAPFPKTLHDMSSKQARATKHTPRDAEKEGRVFPTPQHRTAAALVKHKKTIDDLSSTLPIAHTNVGATDDTDEGNNYNPKKIEKFTTGFKNPYNHQDDGTNFAYAPPSFQDAAHDLKLDKILRMIEQNKVGYESASSQDMLLYIFTGVFFLFTLDTFVMLGKRMK